MRVMDIMEEIPVIIAENKFVAEILPELSRCREALYPVTDGTGRLLGTVSPTDILEVCAESRQAITPVHSLVNPEVQTVTAETMVDDVACWTRGEMYVVDDRGILKGRLFPHQVCQVLRTTLQSQKFELSTLLQSIHNGILAVDRKGRITIVNAAAERFMGFSAHSIIGKYLLDILPDSGALLKVMETGQAEFGSSHRVGDTVLLVNRSPVIENGEVIGAVSVFQDITESEAVNAQLSAVKELNKELEAIFESSYDAIVVTDGEGKLLKISSSFSRISGIPREEAKGLIGRSMQEIEKRGMVSESVSMKVLKQKRPLTIMQKQGRTNQEILITGNPIFDDAGKIVRVVTNFRDLTEVNALKEEVKYNRKLNAIYSTELAELRAKQTTITDMVVRSPKMQRVLECAYRVAQVDSTVLITGETGVGKEMIAKYIHQVSSRKDQPFIQINCGAIPENLLESELFGYEKGAFTGADRNGKVGLFEIANHGTILLDEIGEMPQSLQVKLLRVLQEQQLQRIGGVKPIKLDVRILTATNKNLEEMVLQGTFREDLYYRLNVVPLHVLPLRERREDIIPLALFFLNKFNTKFGFNKILTQEVTRYLERCYWPGNVRELENVLEQMIVMSSTDKITLFDIPGYLEKQINPVLKNKVRVYFNDVISLKEAEEVVERELLIMTLRRFNSARQAAKVLGVNHSTVLRKLTKYNIM